MTSTDELARAGENGASRSSAPTAAARAAERARRRAATQVHRRLGALTAHLARASNAEGDRYLRAVAEAVRATPDDGPTQLAFGVVCLHARAFAEAARALRRAAALAPDDADAHYHLALAIAAARPLGALRGRAAREALAHVERAIALDTRWAHFELLAAALKHTAPAVGAAAAAPGFTVAQHLAAAAFKDRDAETDALAALLAPSLFPDA